MSRGINKVILIGNLGADPDIRYTQSGDAVANVSLATSETWKDRQSGEARERTEWHRVVFFGKLAPLVQQYLRKGSKVYLEGPAAHPQVAGPGRSGPLRHRDRRRPGRDPADAGRTPGRRTQGREPAGATADPCVPTGP